MHGRKIYVEKTNLIIAAQYVSFSCKCKFGPVCWAAVYAVHAQDTFLFSIA